MLGPRILLIVGGGIAAYKACELVRLIRKGAGGVPGEVTCVLTEGGAKFVTPLALAALSENPVHTTLWDLKNEVEMGHIQLSRQADLVVVCPATANLLAKMAAGIADDLATTLLLATDKRVLAVPAMNVRMWQHAATRLNVEALRAVGVDVMEPDDGVMACGEFGPGRLPEPFAVWQRIAATLGFDAGEPDQPVIAYAPLPQGHDDDEEPQSEDTGLGGLSGSLIARSRKKGKTGFDDIEPPLPDIAELPPVPEDVPPLNLAGPVLAKKGKAKSAPPTDPDAINHLVSGKEGAAPPEPFLEEMAPGKTGHAAHPELLDGQPDFEFDPEHRPLFGKHVLVTAGPTHEPIDPVRYIANRSSGKQGFAIAAAAAAAGAQVTLISGPVNLATPRGVDRIDVETARQMADAVKKALPVDCAVMVAAVADWRAAETYDEKIKKRGSAPPALVLTENPDILATVASSPQRPSLVIGFAAETENLLDNAKRKRKAKGVDWMVANDVAGETMGGDDNTVHLIRESKVEDWPAMSKQAVAHKLVERIAAQLTEAEVIARND